MAPDLRIEAISTDIRSNSVPIWSPALTVDAFHRILATTHGDTTRRQALFLGHAAVQRPKPSTITCMSFVGSPGKLLRAVHSVFINVGYLS